MHTECYPISILPKLSRLFVDYASSREPLAPFYNASPYAELRPASAASAHSEIADLLLAQNLRYGAGAATLANIERIRAGAPAVITGQQVTLFGGPLFTLLKAATAIRRAKDSGAVPIFWMATEDHDLAEADHVVLPSRHELHTLRLNHGPEDSGKPVGRVRLGEGVAPLLEQAAELLGPGPALESLRASRQPQPSAPDPVTYSAADPMNLVGVVIPGEREAAVPGRTVTYPSSDKVAEIPSAIPAAALPLNLPLEGGAIA